VKKKILQRFFSVLFSAKFCYSTVPDDKCIALSYSRILYCIYYTHHKPPNRLPAIYIIIRHNIFIADFSLVTINEGPADAFRSTYIFYIINKPERYCRSPRRGGVCLHSTSSCFMYIMYIICVLYIWVL